MHRFLCMRDAAGPAICIYTAWMQLRYDCAKCPAYCCTYESINVSRRDLKKLAKHFGIDLDVAEERFTKIRDGEVVLRHRKDATYGSSCIFLDPKNRRCTVYDARPHVCTEYPDHPTCGYYEFLKWERRHQGDEEFVPRA